MHALASAIDLDVADTTHRGTPPSSRARPAATVSTSCSRSAATARSTRSSTACWPTAPATTCPCSARSPAAAPTCSRAACGPARGPRRGDRRAHRGDRAQAHPHDRAGHRDLSTTCVAGSSATPASVSTRRSSRRWSASAPRGRSRRPRGTSRPRSPTSSARPSAVCRRSRCGDQVWPTSRACSSRSCRTPRRGRSSGRSRSTRAPGPPSTPASTCSRRAASPCSTPSGTSAGCSRPVGGRYPFGGLLSLHDQSELTVSASRPTSLQVDGEPSGTVSSVTFRSVRRALERARLSTDPHLVDTLREEATA